MSGLWVRRVCLGLVSLSLTGAFFTGECVAQDRDPNTIIDHLSIDPRVLATGTRTEKAGPQLMDGDVVEDSTITGPRIPRVYVPQQCVGTRRCPLLFNSQPSEEFLIPIAEKYGIILGVEFTEERFKEILRKFAVDPEKIAIVGHSAGARNIMGLAAENLHIFSRVITLAGGIITSWTSALDPSNTTTEFLVGEGLLEDVWSRDVAIDIRRRGHPAKRIVTLSGHEWHLDAYEFVGRWLHESWAKPDSTTRTVPAVVADPLPEVTMEVLTRMTTFWTSFQQEPESIRTIARREHLREVAVPVAGPDQLSTLMVDMAALAAQYPSVAADLAKAGLTAQQHEACRVALISAIVAAKGRGANAVAEEPDPLDPNSVLTKNVAFMMIHPRAFAALLATDIWRTP